MQKQKNNITTHDLIKTLEHMKHTYNRRGTNYVIKWLFWIQDSIISESVNFYIINSVLAKYQLRDFEKPPFKHTYGLWRKHNGKHVSKHDVFQIINTIIVRLRNK